MNVKLHSPKSLSSGSGLSSMKQLLLSLVATTISIALTFGTAAFLDHRKKMAEKREMVMMILTDFDKSIERVQQLDSIAHQTFETQLSILEDPETFDARKYELMLLQVANKDDQSRTTEAIFSSSIETINTLGNILFAEKVSDFYLNRQQLFNFMNAELQELYDDEKGITVSYENLAKNSLSTFISLCDGYKRNLEETYVQCKQMMGVSDEKIAAFVQERQKFSPPIDEETKNKFVEQMQERNKRFQQAIEAGRQKKAS